MKLLASLSVCACLAYGQEGFVPVPDPFNVGTFYLHGLEEKKGKSTDLLLLSYHHTALLKDFADLEGGRVDCNKVRIKVGKMKSQDLAKATQFISFRSTAKGSLKTMAESSYKKFWEITKDRRAQISNEAYNLSSTAVCLHDVFDTNKVLEDVLKLQDKLCKKKGACKTVTNSIGKADEVSDVINEVLADDHLWLSFGYSEREETLRHIAVIKSKVPAESGIGNDSNFEKSCKKELAAFLKGKSKVVAFYAMQHLPSFEVLMDIKNTKSTKVLTKYLHKKKAEFGDFKLGIFVERHSKMCPFFFV